MEVAAPIIRLFRMPDKKLTPEEIAANRLMLTHVKAWLRYRDTTQRRLAEALGMSEPSVSKWLGGGQAVSVAQFVKIAQFLDADPSEILSAPPGRDKAIRYKTIAEVAQDMPPDALEEWLAVGRRMKGKR